MICDQQGMMWLSTLGGGVTAIITRELNFALDHLENIKKVFKTNSVRNILVDDEGLMWLSIGTYGLVVYNRQTGEWWNMRQLGFPGYGFDHLFRVFDHAVAYYRKNMDRNL